jgi:hypothetical protein
LSPKEDIDWRAVRKKLESRLRGLKDILPKELTAFEKMVEFKDSLPRKVKFTEPITQKLRMDRIVTPIPVEIPELHPIAPDDPG